ncbi:MAG: glycoside hydrolase family 2 protein, partial [Oscillospiraceae bacterium]|nr:glycoside hydrolase family 2 protein [Oscillospiraceae bacterium]
MGGAAGTPVNLPHDAMIREERRIDSPNGPDAAWYDGGTYVYEKELSVPADWNGKSVLLELEGVASNAMVYVDGQFAGKCPSTYTDFRLEIGKFLNYGGVSRVKVLAKTGMQRTSRWYSGSGIIRPVWLWVGGETHIAPEGIRFTTERCDASEAVVTCAVTVEHHSVGRAACRVITTVCGPDGAVAAAENQPLTLFGREEARVQTRFCLRNPRLWDVDDPALYTVAVQLVEGETVIDEDSVRTGIRTVTVDHENGLRVNGRTVKLRGGAIHHDNGILGAVTRKDAEVRRVQRLKAAGFNAIRSAHNPASKALVEACDEVGMFLMDELFDVWNDSKRDHDYALFFHEWWQRDMASIVQKDSNHPSVILYTIGNEIPETGTAAGAAQNRAMTNYFRTLDPTRPVANCINGMMSIMPHMRTILAEVLGGQVADLPTDINELMSMFDANIDEIMKHPIVTAATEETFAGVDVCGYNYMPSRYRMDGEQFPNRVIVGSETNPDKIGYHWPLILEQNHVIGDFCWTAWDYIGESGIGKNDYEMNHGMMYGPWPWFLAYCGDLDICGNRRPQSYYREIVYGLRAQPYVAVERPEHYNQPKCVSNWTWPDVIESWTWPGFEGKRTHVEVYADGDAVALYLNNRLIEAKPVGEEMPYKAIFDVIYQPGTLTAV